MLRVLYYELFGEVELNKHKKNYVEKWIKGIFLAQAATTTVRIYGGRFPAATEKPYVVGAVSSHS